MWPSIKSFGYETEEDYDEFVTCPKCSVVDNWHLIRVCEKTTDKSGQYVVCPDCGCSIDLKEAIGVTAEKR